SSSRQVVRSSGRRKNELSRVLGVSSLSLPFPSLPFLLLLLFSCLVSRFSFARSKCIRLGWLVGVSVGWFGWAG
ncbi:hypothetical protein IWX46DRAFT_586006, partial [Phyllosticta citricarpa]